MRKRWWRDLWWRIKEFELAFLIKKSDWMVIILIILPLFLNIFAGNIFPFLLRVASNLGKGQTNERSFVSILYLFKTLFKCPPGCLRNCNLPLIVLFVFAAHASCRCQDLSSVLRSPVHVFSMLSHCLSTWKRGWNFGQNLDFYWLEITSLAGLVTGLLWAAVTIAICLLNTASYEKIIDSQTKLF